MSRQVKNRISSLFLLLVFSLNTLAGFACSIGVNMGYNKTHHQHSAKSKTQKKHHHGHHTVPEKKESKTDPASEHQDCCSNVTKLSLADKSVGNTLSFEAPVFFIAFVSRFLLQEESALSLLDNTTATLLRRSWNLHDHTNLRIVMQSFQI
jgi:hypothetical protein